MVQKQALVDFLLSIFFWHVNFHGRHGPGQFNLGPAPRQITCPHRPESQKATLNFPSDTKTSANLQVVGSRVVSTLFIPDGLGLHEHACKFMLLLHGSSQRVLFCIEFSDDHLPLFISSLTSYLHLHVSHFTSYLHLQYLHVSHFSFHGSTDVNEL